MNERINQLWGQALDAAVPETYTELSYSQVLKIKQVFAESIVKECADELIKWKDEPFPYDPEFGAKLIKEHFGIKE